MYRIANFRRVFFAALLVSLTSSLSGSECQAVSIPVINSSFDDASNFNFTNNFGDIPVTAGDLGTWMVRNTTEDTQMDFADTSLPAFGSLSGQTGGTAVLLQSIADRGMFQFFDVSTYDVTGVNFTLSYDIAAPGATSGATVELYGFSDFTGLTVDLGGASAFSGGTYSILATTTLTDGDLSDTAFQTKTLSTGALGMDFDYIGVILGGDAEIEENDLQYIAYDNILLENDFVPPPIPEPSSFMLLGLGLLGLLRRARRK